MILDLMALAYSVFFPPPPRVRQRCVSDASAPNPQISSHNDAHDAHDAPDSSIAIVPGKNTRAAKVDPGQTGEFYFRDDVLDKLDHYMIYVRRLRRKHPDAYASYTKLGGSIIPTPTMIEYLDVPSWFCQTLPSFCCTSLAVGKSFEERDAKEGRYSPRFIMLTKNANRPTKVQYVANVAAYYTVMVYFAVRTAKSPSAILEYPIALLKDGSAVACRSLVESYQNIKSKKGSMLIEGVRWGFHGAFHDWGAEQSPPVSAEKVMTKVFTAAASAYERQNSSVIRVAARKGGDVACFALNVLRTPSFFKDRQVTIDGNGVSKRIFHITRTHPRTLADGRVIPIKTHFRGLRNFMWNGYEINISVPGKHHANTAEFDLGSYDRDELKSTKGYLTVNQMGDAIQQHISTGRPMP
jgi:hypothetical protein